jgi:dienelactone hydrolase
LFYDKRGTGESTGNWQRAGFDQLVDDVLAGVRYLKTKERIAPDKIGLWGVSQAGWIIPLAASKSNDVAFVVPVSGGAVTPAEQETWRRRQNLVYLGVDERFIEAGRKAFVMAFEWQRGNQTGAMPLANPFASDDLNMYHDAAAVIANVRQPTLAIFGGLDTLTPPRESAAIWAEQLRKSGNDDFSIRLFPKGTHGLSVGGKTGVRFEITPEVRFVPGYWDTMLAWIRHHTGGPEFADARRVDADPGKIPVESRGMHKLHWYGSGLLQPWLLVGFVVIFVTAVLALPLAWLWRVISRGAAPEPDAKATARLAAVAGTWILATLVALIYVLHQIADAEPHPVLENLPTLWNVLVTATWISLVAGALFLRRYVSAWGTRKISRPAAVYYAVVGLAVILWIPFVYYWDLLLPAR